MRRQTPVVSGPRVVRQEDAVAMIRKGPLPFVNAVFPSVLERDRCDSEQHRCCTSGSHPQRMLRRLRINIQACPSAQDASRYLQAPVVFLLFPPGSLLSLDYDCHPNGLLTPVPISCPSDPNALPTCRRPYCLPPPRPPGTRYIGSLRDDPPSQAGRGGRASCLVLPAGNACGQGEQDAGPLGFPAWVS